MEFYVVKTNDIFILTQVPTDGELIYGPASKDVAFQALLELRNGRKPAPTITNSKGGSRVRKLMME